LADNQEMIFDRPIRLSHPIHPLPLVTISAEPSLHELSLFMRAARRDVLVSSQRAVSTIFMQRHTSSFHPYQGRGSSHIRGQTILLPAIAHISPAQNSSVSPMAESLAQIVVEGQS